MGGSECDACRACVHTLHDTSGRLLPLPPLLQWFERVLDVLGIATCAINAYVTKASSWAAVCLQSGANGCCCCCRCERTGCIPPDDSLDDCRVLCLPVQEYVMMKKQMAAKRE